MDWPAHFPDNCPPPDAEPISGTVYRYIDSAEPNEWDFMSHWERDDLARFSNADPCQVRGLSVFLSLEEAKAFRRQAVRFFLRQHIAAGELKPQHGVIKAKGGARYQTFSTWWVPAGISAASLFTAIVGPER